ncbi:spartin a isoform X1 [Coregonus clupeaformis]|uniref:spartin a isoform X1 n=1 Tax=Coregonus clupeaformis TaxID=59861 RepID=UPI001E1C42A9|nr:spartin a isoform X1 [Coregonus clupeaformis]XP_045064170.1 spartin a isoform X1 [Coregonus clupeaformis]XP_045064171.1 spartin a isoform X1 [Coregonus clupeaformis]
MSLAEPAELLLIRDHYDRALDCLTRGLAADQAGQGPQALELYRRGRQHLTLGLEVPTRGPRNQGAPWDTARQLQQKMRETLTNISTRVANMETAGVMTAGQGGPALVDLVDLSSQCLYPTLGPLVPPVPQPGSSNPLLHLYPTLPPKATPTDSLPAGTTGTTMATSLPVIPALPLGLPGEQPPAYTPKPTDGHHSLAYGPAGGGGLGLGGAPQPRGEVGGDGEELLFLPRGVQMFFVSSDGQVGTPSYPGYLRIIRFSSQLKDMANGGASAFLHVCDWLYPLMPDTPVLLSTSGIFMFPDTMAGMPGSYVGVVLSSELPAADRHAFQDLLSQLTELRVQGPEEGAGSEIMNLSEKVPIGLPVEGAGAATGEEKPPLPEWSEMMSQGILAGASWLSKGFVRGAEATGKAIHKGASKLREHITPENVPAEVSPGVTKSLHHAKQATGGAVRVSQFLVDGVCTVAGCVGEKLAPHVKKHGSKLIPESMKNTKDGRSNLDGAMEVAVSSMQGLSTIWTGLETGAKNIGKSVTSETVTTVKHKYGDDVSKAMDTGIQSVINVGVAAFNVDNLGIKGVLKTAGKQTAKAVCKEQNNTTQATVGDHNHTVNGGPAEKEMRERKNKEEEKK